MKKGKRVAVCLLAALTAFSLVGCKDKPLKKKEIAFFGDSIIGNTRDESSVSGYVAEKTGAKTYNFGFGGCQMSSHERNWDTCSMYQLSDYLYARDFTAFQKKLQADSSEFWGYFFDTAETLIETDFSKMDAIVISYGTNDYADTTSVLDNPDDLFDYHTVIGALRYSVYQIQRTYPEARILVTTPIYRVFLDENNQIIGNSDTTSFGSGTLEEYSIAMQAACKQMKVACLDLYHESNFNANTWQHYYDENDGTHPNALGREHIATLIGNKLQALL